MVDNVTTRNSSRAKFTPAKVQPQKGHRLFAKCPKLDRNPINYMPWTLPTPKSQQVIRFSTRPRRGRAIQCGYAAVVGHSPLHWDAFQENKTTGASEIIAYPPGFEGFLAERLSLPTPIQKTFKIAGVSPAPRVADKIGREARQISWIHPHLPGASQDGGEIYLGLSLSWLKSRDSRVAKLGSQIIAE